MGTWITDEMIEAYVNLHQFGYAHSVEVWKNDELIGGLYGVAMGQIFFGESMFSKQANASKVAFVYLCNKLVEANYTMIDCQIHTGYLESFGARFIERDHFLSQIAQNRTLWSRSKW